MTRFALAQYPSAQADNVWGKGMIHSTQVGVFDRDASDHEEHLEKRVALPRRLAPRFFMRVFDGAPLPVALGGLRYNRYISEQSKTYPTADHRDLAFYDEADRVSIHILCFDEAGSIGAALRLTPYEVAKDLEIFRRFVASSQATDSTSVVLSRLVRSQTKAGAKSITPIFRFTYDFCLRHDWRIGILHTNQKLVPLFLRYGWKRQGRPFWDENSGTQVPLALDALDGDHLCSVASPYLAPPDGRIIEVQGDANA
jgi:predicted GNAT family N-acyltransferase